MTADPAWVPAGSAGDIPLSSHQCSTFGNVAYISAMSPDSVPDGVLACRHVPPGNG